MIYCNQRRATKVGRVGHGSPNHVLIKYVIVLVV